ncbi:hypothetical protein [Gluconobacter japonicus]|uniref:hypothetical protein n=1 Tax=Gluconobacter japonicus TaxID=376620 RepID=UPI0039E802D2
MSIAIVRAEIERFLKSPEPEVLCISGRWGVGKTFAWQHYLRDIEDAGQLAMARYAYVSLFGLSSLSELRNAIVENTVIADGTMGIPDAETLHSALRKGEKLVRNKSRPLLNFAGGFFKIKDAGDALYRAAFLTVRNQLICFDDLERANSSLTSNDFLGLASVLREQRRCKIVILLNVDAMSEENKKNFDENIEKVADIFLTFDPTCDDVLEISIKGTDLISEEIRKRIKILEITNIRVIKKIERWAFQIGKILTEFDKGVLKQAISTVVFAGWAFLQPKEAPTLDFLRSERLWLETYLNKQIPPQEQRWRDLLQKYGYDHSDDLDKEIIDGVSVGYFNKENITKYAVELDKRIKSEKRDDSFSKAWNLYHYNFNVDDDEILDLLYKGAEENLKNILPVNINSAIMLLRKYGRNADASCLARDYVAAHSNNPAFLSRSSTAMFFDGKPDSELNAALIAAREKVVDKRNPIERLKKLAENNNGFNPEEDVQLISRLTTDEWINLIDTPNENLKRILEWGKRLASQNVPKAELLQSNLNNALSTVAERSPMRKDRLIAWGVLS